MKRFRRVATFVLGLFFVLPFLVTGAAAGSPPDPQAATAAAEPRVVEVGFYAMTVQGLDQQNNSYYADFYLWFRWEGDDIDPSATFEFMNNIERWGLSQTAVYEEPFELDDGSFTQQFHVQGQFFSPLDLDSYPLDSHTLAISIEDTAASDTEQVYVFDTTESGLDPAVRLPGWTIIGTSDAVTVHQYATTFGQSTGQAGSTFSQATFGIEIERPKNFFVWKLMLPLVIVMLVAISILLVHPSLVELRLAAPATALLALVFLQQGYADTLPENGDLVLLDKIYGLAYGLVVALIAATILTSYWSRSEDRHNDAQTIALDRWIAIGLSLVFGIGTAVLIIIG